MSLFRRKPKIVDLTTAAYCRWLRARSPQPLQEFLGYDEDAQENLAGIGDDYTKDVASEAAYALLEAADVAAEESAARAEGDDAAIAAHIARTSANNVPHTPPRREPTMGGTTQRQTDRVVTARQAKDASRRLMGRAPDPVEAK